MQLILHHSSKGYPADEDISSLVSLLVRCCQHSQQGSAVQVAMHEESASGKLTGCCFVCRHHQVAAPKADLWQGPKQG